MKLFHKFNEIKAFMIYIDNLWQEPRQLKDKTLFGANGGAGAAAVCLLWQQHIQTLLYSLSL